jgi:hypothetical protein
MQEILELPMLCGFHRSLTISPSVGVHAPTVTGDFSIPFS